VKLKTNKETRKPKECCKTKEYYAHQQGVLLYMNNSDNSTKTQPQFSIRDVLAYWCLPGEVYELRAPKCGKNGTISGYYDDLDKLAKAAEMVAEQYSAPAVYLTLNPCIGAVRARAYNRLEFRAVHTTSDAEIKFILRMLVDCDWQRPAGISSTNEEHDAAIRKACQIRDWLDGLGWPVPILADSGNGGHLFYAVQLERTAENISLIERCLKALHARFGDGDIAVDCTVFNPSRINKLYGTAVRKGDDLPDRPHRLSAILEAPAALEVVPRELLEALAGSPEQPKAVKESGSGQPGPAPTGDSSASVAWVEAFLAKHEIHVDFEKPASGKYAKRWLLEKCPFCGEADKAATVMVWTDGTKGYSCSHNRCAKIGWQDFRAKYEPAANAVEGSEGKGKKVKQSVMLVEKLRAEVELWQTPDDLPCCTIQVKGRKVDCLIASTAFRQWVSRKVYDLAAVIGRTVLDEVIDTFTALALDAPVSKVYRRIARCEDVIWIDLNQPGGEIAKVMKTGWSVVKDCPVKFFRTQNAAALPLPVSGDLNQMRKFVNLTDSDWILLRGFLLSCYSGQGPYFGLMVGGETGSAKSTLCRLVRRLVDPVAKAELRGLHRDLGDMATAAQNNYLLAFDNVSSLPQWLSDAIASLVTGSGYATRGFYQQDEEKIYGECRPVILNGIPDFAESSDLLDRLIKIVCPELTEEERKAETEFIPEFERAQPAILGGILDALVSGLQNENSCNLARKSRMAQAENWIHACELGTAFAGQFVPAYHEHRQELRRMALEASVVATVLIRWLDHSQVKDWKGTATDLAETLASHATDLELRQPRYPKHTNVLSSELRRAKPDLRAIGVLVDKCKSGGKRAITVQDRREACSADDGDDEGGRWGRSLEKIVPSADPHKHCSRDDGDDRDDLLHTSVSRDERNGDTLGDTHSMQKDRPHRPPSSLSPSLLVKNGDDLFKGSSPTSSPNSLEALSGGLIPLNIPCEVQTKTLSGHRYETVSFRALTNNEKSRLPPAIAKRIEQKKDGQWCFELPF
jgi:hypothetical protein